MADTRNETERLLILFDNLAAMLSPPEPGALGYRLFYCPKDEILKRMAIYAEDIMAEVE